jgi:uncharacterized protein
MVDFTNGQWVSEPKKYRIHSDFVEITTEAETDFWQRSFYGFIHDNAPGLLIESDENFTFTTRVCFDYKTQFDQCGVLIYLDSENWCKASVEYENAEFSRLGSVVTNLGYSDWATSDISLPEQIWYRLSRRGPDFLIESSLDGIDFRQMRIFHMNKLGETTVEMGKSKLPHPADNSVRFGVYACSPLKSSFTARFTNMSLETCKWLAHED